MRSSKPDPLDSLKAQLRQVENLASKGLLRAEEAQAQRHDLRRRLLQAVLPDEPAPRLPWRARLGAALAMALLVTAGAAYLLSDRAGLRRESIERLDAARRPPPGPVAAHEAPAPAAAGSPAGPGVAPLLAGRVELAPALRARIRPDDAVFVVVRLPGDPDGLPLAALRREAGELPFDYRVGTAERVGDPARLMKAAAVVVSARVSRSGSGRAQAGDLLGTAGPVAPWTPEVRIVIDRVLAEGAPGVRP